MCVLFKKLVKEINDDYILNKTISMFGYLRIGHINIFRSMAIHSSDSSSWNRLLSAPYSLH